MRTLRFPLVLVLALPATLPAHSPAHQAAPQAPEILGIPLDPAATHVSGTTAFWRIESASSRVSFQGHSTLHSFTGVTSAIEGVLACDWKDPGRSASADVSIDARTLDTGNDSRDAQMHEDHLESARFPWIRFSLDDLTQIERDDPQGPFHALARGLIEIHGIRTGIQIPIQVRRRESQILADGTVPLLMSRFGIEPPSKLWVIRVQDQVEVTFHVEATLTRASEETKVGTSAAAEGEKEGGATIPAGEDAGRDRGGAPLTGDWISRAESPGEEEAVRLFLRISRDESFVARILVNEEGTPRLRTSRGTLRREGVEWTAKLEGSRGTRLHREGATLLVEQGDTRVVLFRPQ